MTVSKNKVSAEKVAKKSVSQDLGQVAKQAYVDIANTYQAVLMQDTGWTRQGILPELTQDTAERVAKADVAKANEPEKAEPELEPPKDDPGKDDYVIE